MSEHSSKDFSFSQLIYWTKIQIEVGEGALIINTGEVSKNTSQIAAGLWHFTLGAFLGGYKQKQTSLLSKSWCFVSSKDYVTVLSLNIPAPPAVWPGLAGEGSLTHCSLVRVQFFNWISLLPNTLVYLPFFISYSGRKLQFSLLST